MDWSFRGVKGTTLTSEHYLIHTTCRDKPFVNALPGFLEDCWQAYSVLLPSDNAVNGPLTTYLFASRWEWERFTEEFTGPRADLYKKIRSGGYSERGVTVTQYDSARSALSVLAHEGLHQYLEVTHGKPIPAWLNEGLACYFESFDLDGENRPVFIPEKNTLRSPALREAVSAHGLIPLTDVLGTNAGLEVHKRSSHVSKYYSQEWSLVLFLMQPSRHNSYQQGFLQLLRELGTDTMQRKARAFAAADTEGNISEGEAVFRAYVTEDLPKFQSDYEDYLHKLLGLVTS